MNSKINKKTYDNVLGGVCLAFAVACVCGAGMIPGMELTLYAVSGIFTGVIILEAGVKSAALFYVGAVILSFIGSPTKIDIVPYACFFGLYGFIKFFAEKARNAVVQIIIKIAVFSAVFVVAFFGFKELFFANIKLPDYSIWILAVGGSVMLLLYDYIYTLALYIYRQRIKREKINIKLSGEDDGNEKR